MATVLTVKPNRVLAYIRVSTEEQARGDSPNDQKRELIAWCEREGWPMPFFYEDLGLSGGDLERPQLRALMNDAREGDFVIAWSNDRMYRDAGEQLVQERDLRKQGKTLRFLNLNMDLSTLGGRAALGGLAMAAEITRLKIQEDTKRAMKQAEARGIKLGRPPKWFRIVEDPTTFERLLEPTETAHEIVRRLRRYGVVETAKFANTNPKQVYRLVQNIDAWAAQKPWKLPIPRCPKCMDRMARNAPLTYKCLRCGFTRL